MIRSVEEVGAIKAMSFCTWNVRSLVKHFDEVKRFLLIGKIDIMVLIKTFLNDSIEDDRLNIDGYLFYRAARTVESGKCSGGAIMIYVRSSIVIVPILSYFKCTPDFESLWMRIKLTNSCPFYLCALYRPPPMAMFLMSLIMLKLLSQTYQRNESMNGCCWVI